MKKLALMLVACLGLAGCAVEYVEPVDPMDAVISDRMQHGCVVVTDELGEREVCNTQYYYYDGGVVYWDAHFGVWVGPNGYWRNRAFFPGIYPGFHTYYHTGFYHPRGFYHGGRLADGDGHGGGRPPPMSYHGGFRGHGGHR